MNIEPRGIVFGHTVSPSAYQKCNLKVTGNVCKYQKTATCYIDDKGGVEECDRDPQGTETTYCCFYTILTTIAWGFFMAVEKSVFIPTRRILFLGFEYDTLLCEIGVPREKFEKICAEIHILLDAQLTEFTLKDLQHVRVSF